jgi:hypothetical protein
VICSTSLILSGQIAHPDRHSYAPAPGKVKLSFAVNSAGYPADIRALLQDAAAQVNQQQPYSFEVRKDIDQNHIFYRFVSTRTHDQEGNLVTSTPYLERKITFSPHTDIVPGLFGVLGQSLHSTTGLPFSCCFGWMVERGPWHGPRITYEATDQPARKVLEDLIVRTGIDSFYVVFCQPTEKRSCFLNVMPVRDRMPITSPHSGVCTALGLRGY